MYRSPQKNIRNFKHPKKYLKFSQPQKIYRFCILILRKDPKNIELTPKTSPIFGRPQKNIHKIFIPQKIFIFPKIQKNIEIQKFDPK